MSDPDRTDGRPSLTLITLSLHVLLLKLTTVNYYTFSEFIINKNLLLA